MPRYQVSIESPRPAPEMFAYLAEFDNIREWDPSVESARRLDEGELRLGSAFEVVVRVGRRTLPLRYEVVRLEPGALIALEAKARWFRSYDVISVSERGAGSMASYDALLELKRLARLAAPFMGKAFRTIGDDAADGLRRVLSS
jgi:Polyketide cyclase / dehydrase and lipid transport